MSELIKLNAKMDSHYALLALFGQKCRQEKLLEPLHQLVKIKQKKILHSPTDKLQDLLVTMMMGKQTVYETNTSLSTEPALWYAFGRTSCADQSTIQRTLAVCTIENVEQMQQVNQLFFRNHSQTCHHDFAKEPLIIDFDLSGLPCSKHYEAATRGYFCAAKPGTTGRQLVRASASQYGEIVYQRVVAGNSNSAQLELVKQLIAATWQVLGLDPQLKGQILLRLDGGFGTTDIINYLLAEGYQFVVKLFSNSRVTKLAQAVSEWQWDECHQRHYALLTAPHGFILDPPVSTEAVSCTLKPQRQLLQIAVRCHSQPRSLKVKQRKGKISKAAATPTGAETYHYSVLVVWRQKAEHRALVEQLHFYDERATIETASFSGDKQGLAIAKRRKRSLIGQEILILLAGLAHNLVVWLRAQLSAGGRAISAKIKAVGLKRWIRDWFGMSGQVTFKAGRIVKVRLPPRHEVTRQFWASLRHFFAKSKVRLVLRQF